jgi:hypothetical protein
MSDALFFLLLAAGDKLTCHSLMPAGLWFLPVFEAVFK